jgi:hypothetical protein
VVVEDAVSGMVNHAQLNVSLPRYDDEQLSLSSVILADRFDDAPRNISPIGPTTVRKETFRRTENLCVYAEFYNFGRDDRTTRPSGTVEFEIVENRNNKTVLAKTEEVAKIGHASPHLVVVKNIVPLINLKPGSYNVKLRVGDRVRGNSVTAPGEAFTVTR